MRTICLSWVIHLETCLAFRKLTNFIANVIAIAKIQFFGKKYIIRYMITIILTNLKSQALISFSHYLFHAKIRERWAMWELYWCICTIWDNDSERQFQGRLSYGQVSDEWPDYCPYTWERHERHNITSFMHVDCNLVIIIWMFKRK